MTDVNSLLDSGSLRCRARFGAYRCSEVAGHRGAHHFTDASGARVRWGPEEFPLVATRRPPAEPVVPAVHPSEWHPRVGAPELFSENNAPFAAPMEVSSSALLDPSALRLLVDGLLTIGTTVDKVRQTLMRSGYTRADIDFALSAAGAFATAETPKRAIALDGLSRSHK